MSTDLPLTQHVDTLYPVARVLVGDAGASLLVKHAFRRAAALAPADRPADTEAWLVDLLLRIHNGDADLDPTPTDDGPAADAPTDDAPTRDALADSAAWANSEAVSEAADRLPAAPPGAETGDSDAAARPRDSNVRSEDIQPSNLAEADTREDDTGADDTGADDTGADHADTSASIAEADGVDEHEAGEDDPPASKASAPRASTGLSFRQEIARTVAERAVPVALAACSEQERALLALHVTGPRLDTTLTPIARNVADDIGTALDQAYGQLRAALRDVVTGPERMLIDTALPDRALESTLRAHVTENYCPAPARLRSDVAEIIAQNADSSSESPNPPKSSSPAAAENDRRVRHLRRTGAALLVLAVVGGIAYAAATWLSSPEASQTPPAVPSLMRFSVEQTDAIRRVRDVDEPGTASRTLQNEFGRRIDVPRIDRARLAGIASLSLDTLSIPVLVFVDSTDASTASPSGSGSESGWDVPGAIQTYVYSYALIDQIEVLARLDDDLAARLDTADRVLEREVDGRDLFIWRRGDDVFVTVAGDGDLLASRIRP